MFTNALWATASVSDIKCLFGEAVNTSKYYIYYVNYVLILSRMDSVYNIGYVSVVVCIVILA